jgi:hypothetical protein
MDHWFDSLTKNLASQGITRRTFLDGVLSGIALASLDLRLDRVLAAQAPASLSGRTVRFAPSVRPSSEILPKSLTFGPCAVMTKGSHFERHFKSSTQVSGHTVSVERDHTADKDQPSHLETKLVIDGNPALVSSVTEGKSSRSYRLQISKAFGFTALLTSTGGKTVHGNIDGRAVVPFTSSATGTIRFANGTPAKGQPAPYLPEAIKAAFTHANEDLGRCVAPAQAYNRRRFDTARVAQGWHRHGSVQADPPPCYDCDNWANMVYQPSGAVFSPGCQACINKCNGALNGCLNSNGAAALASFGFDVHADYMLAVGCNDNDVSCITACYAGACLGELCPGEKQALESSIAGGGTLSAPVPGCDRNQVCVSNLGFCCPKTHPNPCPGWYDGIIPGNTIASNICCQTGYACLWDTSSGYFGCCPKERVCTSKTGGYRNAAYGTQGACCPPGEVCDGHGSCCPRHKLAGGVCCGGTDPLTKQFRIWCGGKCIVCDGACINGRCQKLCLGGHTTDGKCCHHGNACGKKCCPYGCANPKTSTCITTPPSIAPPK